MLEEPEAASPLHRERSRAPPQRAFRPLQHPLEVNANVRGITFCAPASGNKMPR